jgi:pimeloyl-ACP methyl ester carboxylesterase
VSLGVRTADTLVPYPFGEHLSKTIPNAIFHKLPDEGHFFPVTHMDEIMEVATSAMTIK